MFALVNLYRIALNPVFSAQDPGQGALRRVTKRSAKDFVAFPADRLLLVNTRQDAERLVGPKHVELFIDHTHAIGGGFENLSQLGIGQAQVLLRLPSSVDQQLTINAEGDKHGDDDQPHPRFVPVGKKDRFKQVVAVKDIGVHGRLDQPKNRAKKRSDEDETASRHGHAALHNDGKTGHPHCTRIRLRVSTRTSSCTATNQNHEINSSSAQPFTFSIYCHIITVSIIL